MDDRPPDSENKPQTVCVQVTYSGRVQGVGFRYTAQSVASDFAVTGYVKNLPNGEVELAAEGVREEVGAFLEALAQRMGGYIQSIRQRDAQPGSYEGFRVRH